MDVREARIALNMLDRIGPVTLRKLIDVFGDPVSVLQASAEELQRVPGIGPETAKAIAQWEETVDLQAELRRIREYGCTVLIPEDEDYPPLLRELYDPPIVLYVKGKLEPRDRNAIAIVGSRRATHYGLEVARKLAYQLAYAGVTVVSGGARGIDSAAHQGALTAKGRTLAVLGSGLNVVFPPENAELFERIAANGALLTQFPFNRHPDRQTFPIRNRIISGLSLGTVVVEAPMNSGALITANMATEQGRLVFAVPGRIDSPTSKGCHDLIKKGAKLCESVEDILSEFEYLFPPARSTASAISNPQLLTLQLNENEQRVYEALGTEERHIDDIIRSTGLPPAIVNATLFQLELKHLVHQLPGKRFVRTTPNPL